MKYSIDEVIKYVRAVFGEGYIEGAFISIDAIFGDIDPEDDEIITSFTLKSHLSAFENDDVMVYMGMTKLVIVPHDRNYVIKIPFTGYYEWDVENENDTNYWEDRYNFRIAGYLQNTNACDIEIKMYEYASDPLRQILLPNEYFGKIDELNIYIQEKFKISQNNSKFCYDEDYYQTISSTKKKIVTKLSNEYCDKICASFIGRLVEQFGIQTTQNILNELKYYDDLHSGNYGYAHDGRCVIFDYAGYSGDYYSIKKGDICKQSI